MLDWNRKLFSNIEGWRDRWKEIFILCGRGSGKTTLCSAICLHHFFCDPQKAKSVILCANTKEQAELLFNIIAAQIRHNPVLDAQVQIKDTRKRIIHTATESTLVAVANDPKGRFGAGPTLVVYDELAASPTPKLYYAMRTAMRKRRNSKMVVITSAGHERGIAYELYDYATKVRDRIVEDPTFMPVIFQAPADLSIDEESTWKLALPSYGHLITKEDMQQEVARAKGMSSYEMELRTFYLSQFVSQSSRYIRMEDFDHCHWEVSDEELKATPGFLSVDLSDTTDLSCIVGCWDIGGRVVTKAWTFIPAQQAKTREETNRINYRYWAANLDNNLFLTSGSRTNYDLIEETIRQICKTHLIESVGYDRYAPGRQVFTTLESEGIKTVAWGQGFTDMNAGTKHLEALITDRKLCNYKRNPIMTWCMSNLEVASNSTGLIRPIKPDHYSSLKVDLAVCCITCLALMTVSQSQYYVPPA